MTQDTPADRENKPPKEARTPDPKARVELYVHGAMAPRYQLFPHLAADWLSELARMSVKLYGHKVTGDPSLPPDQDIGGKALSVTLENGQRIWLRWHEDRRDNPREDDKGFWRAEVRDETASTDKAILAALAVLEGVEVNRAGEQRIRRHLRREKIDPEAREPSLLAKEDRMIALARTLLWFHHPDVDHESDEGINMLLETCKRVATVAKAARHLTDYMEFGVAGRDTRRKIEDVQMDVYAAELHYIAGMSQKVVAEKLRLRGQSNHEKLHGGHATAGDKIKRGRELLIEAFGGEEAFLRYAERHRILYNRV